MKNIGWDLDGVLYSWHEVIYEYLKGARRINGLSYQEYWANFRTYTTEEEMKALASQPDFYVKRNINLDILSMLNRLAEKYALFYITSRPKNVWYTTENWMEKNKLPFTENLITIEGFDKELHIIKNEIELYIDDRTDILDRIVPYTDTILIRQPYNDHNYLNYNFVDNVLEVEDYIRSKE